MENKPPVDAASKEQRGRLSDASTRRGLECRYCKCRHFRVIYTQQVVAAISFGGSNAGIAENA